MFIAICMCISTFFCTMLVIRRVLDVFLYATDKIQTVVVTVIILHGLTVRYRSQNNQRATVRKVSKSLVKLFLSVLHGGC